VFGNTVEPSGQPSRRLAARLETARELFAAKRVRYILVSGGTGHEGFDEAHVMSRYLAGRGVPDSALIEDGRGINTFATCVNARALLRSRHASTVDLVTQYFHVPRARLAAKRAGLEVVGARAPRFFEPRDLYSLAREVVALPVYALK
jgi:vancomycin permeability regulator SanA